MKGKSVLLGVTGGIAAYKACELVRLLVKQGARVQVAMTRAATHFVSPLTFQGLSGGSVIWDMFSQETPAMEHISWGQESDLVIVAPATANIIGKMAAGIGDDFLSTCLLAATAPILVCPSMNTHMFSNPVVQENLRNLSARGMHVLSPDVGDLACGAQGPGRLPEPEHIVETAGTLLAPKDYEGLRVLVTAGPTREPLDPVRYLTNRSSGKMGYALARAASRRGGEVILISGPVSLLIPQGVTCHRVETAEEMRRAVFEHVKGCHVVIKAAAVADYRPQTRADQKIKKEGEVLSLDLVRNPDILAQLGREKESLSYVLVGFAAETLDMMAHAASKMTTKNLDLIVANDVSRKDAGFDVETNQVTLLYRDGRMEESPLVSKDAIADLVLDRIRGMPAFQGQPND